MTLAKVEPHFAVAMRCGSISFRGFRVLCCKYCFPYF